MTIGRQVARREGWRVVVCCASGPSFSEAQATTISEARARGACRVIAVNDNYRRVRNADVLYACDGRWWRVHHAAVEASGFAGERWTQDAIAAEQYGLRHVALLNRPGLTTSPELIHGGGNSGYQAINLAYLFGARTIVLVGYDMQRTDGIAHWFGEHEKPLGQVHPYARWIERMGPLAQDLERAGVDVVNCTTTTALHCFRRASLDEVLTGECLAVR